MVTNLMMSTKIATLGHLKIKVFWIKGCDIITFVCNATTKILSCGSIYIADVYYIANYIPKFGNYTFSMGEVIICPIL